MRWIAMLRAGALALALAAPVAGVAGQSESSAQARAQLSQLRRRIDKVRHQLNAGNHKRSRLSDALAKAQARIGQTQKRLHRLDHAIATHQKRIKKLKRQRDAERHHLSGQLDALARQARAAYETGHVSRMRLLLSNASPAEIGRMLNYYSYFTQAEGRQIRQLKSALAKLAARQHALELERRQLAAQRQARTQTLARLQASRRQQKQTLSALDQTLSHKRASLSDMKSQEQQLEKLLNSVQKQLSNLPPLPAGVPFARLKGRLHPPVAGHVLAAYGQMKNGGPLRWQGEWFAAPEGAPVHAVASGRVVYVGYMKGYGLIVIVNHGHGFYTLYGHASASYVEVGDDVSAGQEIATAGHSGGHSKNGIYFEIRHGQTPVDPAHWLAG